MFLEEIIHHLTYDSIPQINQQICTIPIKILLPFFYRNWQTDPKIHVETEGTQNCQISWKMNKKVGGLPNLKIYSTATVIKTVYY